MKRASKFNLLNKIGLCVALSGLHPELAYSFGQPVISSSLTDCSQTYLIQIYENGKVEYRGISHVKTLGRRETQISQQALQALLKKFDEAGPVLSDERGQLPGMSHLYGPNEAIRLHYGGMDLTLYELGTSNATAYQPTKKPTQTWFGMLQQEIIHTAKADQWVAKSGRQGSCGGKTFTRINNLKTKQ